MKISKWIKLIGIICIAIGVFPLLTEILFEFFRNPPPEIVKERKSPIELIDYWNLVRPYLEDFVDLLYLIGGVFFLMKKAFSIRLMYFVLLFSIFYTILPILLFTPYPVKFLAIISPFVLTGIVINLFLLYSVFKMRKLYLGNPNKKLKILNFSIKSPASFKALTIIGIASILIPISYLALLFYADFSTDNHMQFVAAFNKYAPDIFESFGNEINLLLCVLCLLISLICQSSKSINIRILNIILLILSVLLFMLNLFQMM